MTEIVTSSANYTIVIDGEHVWEEVRDAEGVPTGHYVCHRCGAVR